MNLIQQIQLAEEIYNVIQQLKGDGTVAKLYELFQNPTIEPTIETAKGILEEEAKNNPQLGDLLEKLAQLKVT